MVNLQFKVTVGKESFGNIESLCKGFNIPTMLFTYAIYKFNGRSIFQVLKLFVPDLENKSFDLAGVERSFSSLYEYCCEYFTNEHAILVVQALLDMSLERGTDPYSILSSIPFEANRRHYLDKLYDVYLGIYQYEDTKQSAVEETETVRKEESKYCNDFSGYEPFYKKKLFLYNNAKGTFLNLCEKYMKHIKGFNIQLAENLLKEGMTVGTAFHMATPRVVEDMDYIADYEGASKFIASRLEKDGFEDEAITEMLKLYDIMVDAGHIIPFKGIRLKPLRFCSSLEIDVVDLLEVMYTHTYLDEPDEVFGKYDFYRAAAKISVYQTVYFYRGTTKVFTSLRDACSKLGYNYEKLKDIAISRGITACEVLYVQVNSEELLTYKHVPYTVQDMYYPSFSTNKNLKCHKVTAFTRGKGYIYNGYLYKTLEDLCSDTNVPLPYVKEHFHQCEKVEHGFDISRVINTYRKQSCRLKDEAVDKLDCCKQYLTVEDLGFMLGLKVKHGVVDTI